jgi:hypothetical protein
VEEGVVQDGHGHAEMRRWRVWVKRARYCMSCGGVTVSVKNGAARGYGSSGVRVRSGGV